MEEFLDENKRAIQIEALCKIRANKYNGFFILNTGVGKSWIMIEALKEILNKDPTVKTIWYLCHSTTLRDVDFPEELRKWGAGELIPKIKFMCYQTAYKLKDNNVDVVLCDEVDVVLSPKYVKLFSNNKFKYKLLTTAYIDSDKRGYCKYIAPVVFETDTKELEDKHILNKTKFYYVNYLMSDNETKEYLQHNLNLGKAINNHNVRKTTFTMLQLKKVSGERKRFLNNLQSSVDTCKRLLEDLRKNGKKTIIFCESTAQADKISEYSYHNKSKEDWLEKIRNDEIYELAVCGKINRGTNIKNVHNVIFDSCDSSITKVKQRIGRSKRLSVDNYSSVYFLIPCYKVDGTLKYTKVKDWVDRVIKYVNFEKAEIYRFK